MTAKTGQLLRVLGLAFGWSVTIGNTIGAGILRTPGDAAKAVPSTVAFFGIWIAGGIYALLGAFSLAELGAMIPKSGGQTVFVRRAFGPYPGFVVAWSDWLSTSASVAGVAIVLGETLSQLLPGFVLTSKVMAAAAILFFCALHWIGVRAWSNAQLLTSALKAFAFIALIAACFLAAAPSPSAAVAVSPAALTTAGAIVALQGVIYTYDGWNGAVYFSGEMEDPGRQIPRSMISGVWSVIAIYLLLNIAFVRLIPLDRMAGDPLVADTASRLVFGPAGSTIIRALIALSLLSAINAILLIGSRVLFAMGAQSVNTGGTPTTSLAVTTAIAIMFVVSGTFNQVIALAAFFFVVNYTASFSSVFYLRRREPDTPRPYRAWGYPVTTGIALLGSVAFLAGSIVGDKKGSIIALALLIISYPVHKWADRTFSAK